MTSLNASVIQLTPSSAAFVANRVNTLGPWTGPGFIRRLHLDGYSLLPSKDLLCQARTYFATLSAEWTPFRRYCYWLVVFVTIISVIKTVQEAAVVWVQNVHDYANPDLARTRVTKAWWQITTSLSTGIVGFIVQSFFCLRFFLLSRNFYIVALIVCFMLLGLTGISLSVGFIVSANVPEKVRWLLIHLIGVFSADLLITTGTLLTLRKQSVGLERTTLLVNRLLRMVFESAIPPTLIALVDLILTQTLDNKRFLWHLLLNFSLGKIYVISLLYTLNCINEYRLFQSSRAQEIFTAGNSNYNMHSLVHISTEVSTHVSPAREAEDGRNHKVKGSLE
ncbi:hypothetical protein FB45DRAFT_378374 [Roridomyces roridus]|uniref:DUF6534 domain-containing protein n=1 Tax=Roridomyces roridus TaxID=1738132 RepID=A0AAD7B385_9AGAR|nr:hypothetical protein FB45DRAFT_378374 [Roridomyces roridus]